MKRKTWVMPMTLVQKFEANETVAAAQCYSIACKNNTYMNVAWDKNEVSNAPENGWNGNEGRLQSPWGLKEGFNHNGACRDARNNVFRVDGDNIEFLLEHSSQGDISGGFDSWVDTGNDGFGAGDRVYWHTTGEQALVPMRWNHWGEVVNVDPSRPLHS